MSEWNETPKEGFEQRDDLSWFILYYKDWAWISVRIYFLVLPANGAQEQLPYWLVHLVPRSWLLNAISRWEKPRLLREVVISRTKVEKIQNEISSGDRNKVPKKIGGMVKEDRSEFEGQI